MAVVRYCTTSHWDRKLRRCHPRNCLIAGQERPSMAPPAEESRTPITMPPPQISRKSPERKIITRRNSAVNSMAAHRTRSPLITNSPILPRIVSKVQKASTSSHQTYQKDPKYHDELVDGIPPSVIDPVLYRQSSYPSKQLYSLTPKCNKQKRPSASAQTPNAGKT